MNVDRRLLNLIAAAASTLAAFGSLLSVRRRSDGGTIVALIGLISSASWAVAAYGDWANGDQDELA